MKTLLKAVIFIWFGTLVVLVGCGGGKTSNENKNDADTTQQTEDDKSNQLASRPVVTTDFRNPFFADLIEFKQLVFNDNVTSLIKAPTTVVMFADIDSFEDGSDIKPVLTSAYLQATDGSKVYSLRQNGPSANIVYVFNVGQNIVQLRFPVVSGKNYTEVRLNYGIGPKFIGYTELSIDLRTE